VGLLPLARSDSQVSKFKEAFEKGDISSLHDDEDNENKEGQVDNIIRKSIEVNQ